MLIVLSPAKTLDFESPMLDVPTTLPGYIDQSAVLVKQLKKFSPLEISKLMDISDKLATLNAVRFSSWQKNFSSENSRPAIFAFNGDVYEGLNASSLNKKQLQFAQEHLRILSGLYGILKPLDLMQPYRLEMGTALVNKAGKDLYAFWRSQLTTNMKSELSGHQHPFLINLASEEYFKVLDMKELGYPVISPVFLDEKDGKYKIISFYAKKARGLMARFIIDHQVKSLAKLTTFDYEGYQYCESESTPIRPVFKRKATV